MKNVIFDLDLTLVDTTVLEPFRHSRNWSEAYANIPRCSMYAGVRQVLDYMRSNGIKVCIVSTSPRPYVEKIVGYFGIHADFIVGYHDAKPIKPSPAPMFRALQLLGCTASQAVSFGDRAIDIQSSKAAGIKAVACTWGTKELAALMASAPDYTIGSPAEMIQYLQ
jgi:HAD superfamily hydrolase (TIGR01509 family)